LPPGRVAQVCPRGVWPRVLRVCCDAHVNTVTSLRPGVVGWAAPRPRAPPPKWVSRVTQQPGRDPPGPALQDRMLRRSTGPGLQLPCEQQVPRRPGGFRKFRHGRAAAGGRHGRHRACPAALTSQAFSGPSAAPCASSRQLLLLAPILRCARRAMSCAQIIHYPTRTCSPRSHELLL
jgi:hypothetical protein